MSTTTYPMRIGRRSALLLRFVFGVTADSAWASISDDAMEVRFGRARLRAPLEDIVRWQIEGPWAWITAIGIRRGFRRGDVSFAGSPRGGVRIDLRTPVRWGLLSVPIIYVGVEDLEGFAAELSARGVPGEDARRT